MVMGLVSGLSLANHSDSESFLVVHALFSQDGMLERRILGGGRTCGVSFWPFPNSSGWWRLISSISLTRTSCHKTTYANDYYGAWPGWKVSISVLSLTKLPWGLHTLWAYLCVYPHVLFSLLIITLIVSLLSVSIWKFISTQQMGQSLVIVHWPPWSSG